jgi:hypothetical protein
MGKATTATVAMATAMETAVKVMGRWCDGG